MNLREIAAYLGIFGEIPRDTAEKISSVYADAEKLQGRVQSAEFDILRKGTDFRLLGTDIVLCGRLANDTFGGCQRIMAVLATLGLQSERLLKRYFAEDAERAVLLDACFTERLERILDGFEEDCAEGGRALTRRISPGYGDLPLSLQRELLSRLNPERLGVTLNDSLMLYPNKSVIALIGVKEKI